MLKLNYYPLILILWCSALFECPVRCSSPMKRLYEDLFTDYNRLILPVAKNKTKVAITVGLKLGQILDLNLKQQILSTNVWVEQTWHDYKLQWEPELYEGIDMIHVPAENIWIPDIVLFNNADGNYELTLVAKARVYSNGTVVWKPPTMFRSTCEIDVEYFPFDIQTCFLRFGSWTYAGDEVELRHVGNKRKVEIGIDLSQFYKNVEWDIIDVPAYYNEVYYECCTEPFPDITFQIVIRRKMLFYLVNLILPVALMTFMTVSVFYLPSDSNEKVTLSISILTSLIVFFLLMLEIIPASSLAVPLFGKYLLFTLVLVSLSACVSVYVLNIHHRSPSVHSMSPRVRQIFLKTLPRLLRLNRPDPRERSSLNRFRQKKIAQQMLKASSADKAYELAHPLAASLNLIETLHRSYDFNPHDDQSIASDNGEEERYFRRYVDNYISQMKKSEIHDDKDKLRSCCEHSKCCQRANQNLSRSASRIHRTSYRNRGSVAADSTSRIDSNQIDDSTQCTYCLSLSRNFQPDSHLKTGHGCTGQRSHLGMPNDDTLDMTFDYDEQDNVGSSSVRCPGNLHAPTTQEDNLPSPPPPPRQLTQLSDSLRNRGTRCQSSCSRNFNSNSSEESLNSLERDVQLIDKLINSINIINNVSDEIDTTTTSNNDADEESHTIYTHGSKPFGHIPPLVLGQSGNLGRMGRSDEDYKHGLYQRCQQQASKILPNNPPGLQHQTNSFKAECTCSSGSQRRDATSSSSTQQASYNNQGSKLTRDKLTGADLRQPSNLLLSLRLPYNQMPAHVRAAIRSILFIADTIKNEDDENSAIEDWESMSMVVDRLFLWIFFILCTFGSIIILALAPSLYDQRASIDDKLRIDIPPSNCSYAN